MKVVTSLPDDVHGFLYVKNHHFIELTDKDGNKTLLNASGILIGDCQECDAKVAAFENRERMMCTHCGGKVIWAWTRPQLAFVPEKESDFKPVKKVCTRKVGDSCPCELKFTAVCPHLKGEVAP